MSLPHLRRPDPTYRVPLVFQILAWGVLASYLAFLLIIAQQ